MSIWGIAAFENDDAADWLTELEEAPHLEAVDDALTEIADPTNIGFIEVTECSDAVAAAQTLTEAYDEPGQTFTVDQESLQQLASELGVLKLRVQRELLQRAVVAVQFVANDDDNSELRQLWDDDPERRELWLAVMRDLEHRLSKILSRLK